MSGGELDIQVLKQAATERFSKAAALPIGVAQPDLNSARAAEAEARDRVSGLEGRLQAIDGTH